MTHPLTDKIIDEIACTQAFTHPLTDEKYDDIASSMRAAANWQLERDVEFFKKFLVVSLGIYPPTAELMAQDFKAVMCPQEDNS